MFYLQELNVACIRWVFNTFGTDTATQSRSNLSNETETVQESALIPSASSTPPNNGSSVCALTFPPPRSMQSYGGQCPTDMRSRLSSRGLF